MVTTSESMSGFQNVTKGGGGLKILTIADKGGRGVRQMLTMDDKGGRGVKANADIG